MDPVVAYVVMYVAICLEGMRKSTKILVTTPSFRNGILTRALQNTKLES
jgi:hypothetical protein